MKIDFKFKLRVTPRIEYKYRYFIINKLKYNLFDLLHLINVWKGIQALFDEGDSQLGFEQQQQKDWFDLMGIESLSNPVFDKANFEFSIDRWFQKCSENIKFCENDERIFGFEENTEDYLKYQIYNQQEFWRNIIYWKGGTSKDKFEEIDKDWIKNSENTSIISIISLNESEVAPVFNKSGSIRKKIGRKPDISGLHQRKDIVLKSLLRKIHSFYWKDINSETKYLKNKQKRNPVLRDLLKTVYPKQVQRRTDW